MSDGGSNEDRPSLMRSLGLFFGHVAHGIRANPGADSDTEAAADPDERRIEVNRRVEEEERDGVILRRTTIEEVELPASRPPPDP